MNDVCAMCEADDHRVVYLFDDDVPVCEDCIAQMRRDGVTL